MGAVYEGWDGVVGEEHQMENKDARQMMVNDWIHFAHAMLATDPIYRPAHFSALDLTHRPCRRRDREYLSVKQGIATRTAVAKAPVDVARATAR